MTFLYVDPSALLRAYFSDEPEHEVLRAMLLGGREPVVTSEITRVEHASAVRAAALGGRIADPQELLRRFDLDTRDHRRIRLIALRKEPILALAYELVSRQRLRTLDAIHLAVAMEDGRAVAAGEELAFVTRDEDQAAAARAVGLAVR